MADQKTTPATTKNQAAEPAKAAPASQTVKAVDTKSETPVVAKPATPAVKAAEPAPKAAVAEKAPAVAEKAPAPAAKAPAQATKPVATKPAARAAKPVRKAAAKKPAAVKKPSVRTKSKLNSKKAGAKIMTDTIQKTQDTVKKTQDATKQVAEKATEQFRAVANQANERGKVAMEKSARVAEEMADLTRGNLEAMVASQKTAAKYAETLSQGAADYSRRSFEQASATLRSFAEVKSPTDFFRLQSEYARSAFDQFVAEGSRVTETMVKMSNDVAEPLTGRYAVAAERLKAVAA